MNNRHRQRMKARKIKRLAQRRIMSKFQSQMIHLGKVAHESWIRVVEGVGKALNKAIKQIQEQNRTV